MIPVTRKKIHKQHTGTEQQAEQTNNLLEGILLFVLADASMITDFVLRVTSYLLLSMISMKSSFKLHTQAEVSFIAAK